MLSERVDFWVCYTILWNKLTKYVMKLTFWSAIINYLWVNPMYGVLMLWWYLCKAKRQHGIFKRTIMMDPRWYYQKTQLWNEGKQIEYSISFKSKCAKAFNGIIWVIFVGLKQKYESECYYTVHMSYLKQLSLIT